MSVLPAFKMVAVVPDTDKTELAGSTSNENAPLLAELADKVNVPSAVYVCDVGFNTMLIGCALTCNVATFDTFEL